MFESCSSLTSAPSLPATTLAKKCYAWMFINCNKINKIKMMATDISVESCLLDWALGVSSTGTFIKNAAATWDNTGIVPSGWTVITE